MGGWKLASLFVEIGANTGPLNKVLAGLHARLAGMGSIGSSVSTGIQSLTTAFMNLGSAAPPVIGAIISVLAIQAAALGKCVTLASDFNETVSKTEQVFGSQTKVVTAAADEMASKFGIVKTEFLDAASMFGLIAQGAGVASDKSAEMSVQLAKLAADASSFYNVPVDVALEKIRAGLVGEAEPLRAFGVILSEDAVKAKALAMGLAKPGKELTNQMKIMARLALIKQGMAKAEGDLEKTGGGFANQWRMFTGQLTNLATTVGQLVLPAFTNLLRGVNKVMSGIANSIDFVQGKWAGFLDFIAPAAGKAAKAAEAARLADIDQRNDKMTQQIASEEMAAQAAKKHEHDKSQTFGFADFARSIQENSLNEKDKNGKEQIRLQREQIAIQKEQLAALQNRKQQPVVAIAKK